MRRGQLSLSLVEAGIGVLLVFAVTTTFVVGVPPQQTGEAQLDAYASDVAVLLAEEENLDAAVASPSAFRATRGALADRVEALVDTRVLYRVETPHGSLGYPRPARVTAGVAQVGTPAGTVTVWVWYA